MVHAPIAGSAVPPKDIPAALPHSLELRLNVDEPSMVAQLCGVPEGRARQDLAFAALRIGLLAFDQARGQIDADMVAAEGRRLLERIGDLLGASSGRCSKGSARHSGNISTRKADAWRSAYSVSSGVMASLKKCSNATWRR